VSTQSSVATQSSVSTQPLHGRVAAWGEEGHVSIAEKQGLPAAR
jgi:hypothetical protein